MCSALVMCKGLNSVVTSIPRGDKTHPLKYLNVLVTYKSGWEHDFENC
jgi:hypothetical protein